MKRNLILFVFVFSIITNLFAGVRSEQNAMEIARAFLQNSESGLRSSTNDLSLAHVCSNILRSESEQKPYYYVFNYGDNAGFVIVSGNDQAKEVLGYSNQGSFDVNNLPANFENWLTGYQTEIEYLYSSEAEDSKYIKKEYSISNAEASFATSVSPLLGSLLWDQGSPYSDLCPSVETTKTAVGCVATAMAQIMYYHKWPLKGTGTCAYTTRTNQFNINVALGGTYDWENMTPYYNATSTDTQRNAVATLMYHCGVAVEMDYDIAPKGGSGAYSSDAASALKTNFGYNPNLKYYRRDYTPINEWIDIIKVELNSNRPVFYHGNGTGGGHAYVCDGYDTNDFFHFNWGWSGSSNGYFQLTALNPSSLGSGGGSGGYNYQQGIITEIQKETSDTPMAPYFSVGTITTEATTISRTETFPLSSPYMINLGFESATVKLGWALYDSNDNFVTYLGLSTSSTLSPGKGYNLGHSALKIPTNVPAGNYKIYAVASYSNETKRSICVSNVGIPNYVNATVTSDIIIFNNPSLLPDLELIDVSPVGNVYSGKTGRFRVTIKNNENEYHSNIWLYLQSATVETNGQYIDTNGDPISIAPGATETIEIAGTITRTPGDYYLLVGYDKYNNNDDEEDRIAQLGSAKPISVLDAPSTPSLVLTQTASFPDPENVYILDVSLSPTIKNTGGYFDGNVIAFIYTRLGLKSVASIGLQTVFLDTNKEQTVNLSGILSGLSVGVEYRAVFHYKTNTASSWTELLTEEGNNNQVYFKLTDTPTGIEILNPEQAKLYPNPTSEKLYFESKELVKTIRVFDLSGKAILVMNPMASGEITIPVESMLPGSYILRVETNDDVKSYKFIKQ